MSMVVVNARVDSETKAKAADILESLGMNMSEAINLFFRQIIYTRSIPFELRLPNEATVATFNKTDAVEDLHKASGVADLEKELNN
jgi:DNA-damage-inducible protein J